MKQANAALALLDKCRARFIHSHRYLWDYLNEDSIAIVPKKRVFFAKFTIDAVFIYANFRETAHS